MKSVLCCLLLFLSIPIFVSAQKSKYIGYKYKPVSMDEVLPGGVKNLGGAIITEIDSKQTYGIGRYGKEKAQMLWLEYAAARNQKGILEWEVKDVLVFPNFGKKQELLYGSYECKQNNKFTSKLVVLAEQPRKGYFYIIRRAWRANLQTEKFVEIPTAGIRCEIPAP
jgi:hypothetical protein